MKRIGYLYEKICSIENLNVALKKACQGKHDKQFVKRIIANQNYYIDKLHKDLINETYTLSPNAYKTIKENSSGKVREITVPQFYPDQIIHWAVCLQLKDVFMKGMYHYCCGSVPGRGNLYAKKYIDKIYKKDKKVRYIMKLDIKKFFPSISNGKLKELLTSKIKDKKALRLVNAIIDNGGDGLPIGYYTSQWLSNFYLGKLDHFIKQELKIRHYIRYVDDMVLIDTNKRKLHRARTAINEFLTTHKYKVVIKGNWQLWKIHSRPLDFLGYRFYKEKTLLRKRIFIALSRKVSKINKTCKCSVKNARGLTSYFGWLKHIPSGKHYYLNYIKPIVSKKKLRKIISVFDKQERRKMNDNQKWNRSKNRTVQTKIRSER